MIGLTIRIRRAEPMDGRQHAPYASRHQNRCLDERGYPGLRATAPHKTGLDGPDLVEDIMSKQRREQPQGSIFANNPFLDGIFEWMDSPEGQQCIELRDVLWNLLEDVLLDAKQRKLIWPDAERLDLEQSIQRVQKKYPDFPRDEVEEFLLDWIDMGFDPENYSEANSTS